MSTGKIIEVRGPLSYLVEFKDRRRLRHQVDAILSKTTGTMSPEGGDTDIDETPVIVGPKDFSATVAESAAASDIEISPSARSEG